MGNKLIKKNKYIKWLVLPSFLLGFFVFVNSASAISDGFENYSAGDISPQSDNWSICTGSYSDMSVLSFNPYDGSNALYDSYNATQPCVYTPIDKATTSISFFAERETASSTFGINFRNENDIIIKTLTYLNLGVDYTYDHIRVDISCISNSYQVYNNGSYQGGGNLSVSCNEIKDFSIYIGSGTDDGTFFDNVITESGIEYDWTEDWFETDTNYPNVNMPIQQVCFTSDIDNYCPLEFYYNDLSVGGDLYFIYDNGQSIRKSNSSTSTKIVYNSGFSDFLYLTSQSEATTTPFCIIYDINGYGQVNECGMNIQWVDSTYFPEMPQAFCSTTTDPCSNISTSTTWLGIDFGYSMECSAKRLAQWSFCPSENSYKTLNRTINQWETMFPYSVISQITNSFINTNATTSAFTINITKLTGINGYDTELPLLEEGMMVSTWGILWEKIYSLMEAVLYFFGFMFILFVIILQHNVTSFVKKIRK